MSKKDESFGRGAAAKVSLQFSRINLGLAAGALLTITLGYWLLSIGSITWAPILLVVGYVFLVPLAIIL
ncbi:MAG TPA: hypothetical protein EYQ64_02485 [Gemmatimonadetes bacterium]|nr:hypothetical protein [Gemmatimonadota bacterium]